MSEDSHNGKQKEISFDFIKTPQFREIHVDGAWGGVTPKGLIQMAIYNERLPVPQQTTFVLLEDGLGDELTEVRRGRKAIIRNVEADLLMDMQTAESMRDWLDQNIAQLKERLQQIEDSKGTAT